MSDPWYKPNKLGLVLICLGLSMLLMEFFQFHFLAIVYFGIVCAILGTLVIFNACCFFLCKKFQDLHTTIGSTNASEDNVPTSVSNQEPPPDYFAVMNLPPDYNIALKLSESNLAKDQRSIA